VDTRRKKFLKDKDIKNEHATAKPYGEWLKKSLVFIEDFTDPNIADEVIIEPTSLIREQIAFGYNEEELTMIIEPMVNTHKEPIFSMGDDTPPSAMSAYAKPLFSYFKQLFAQVTNPPIDPIREELVMSLNTILGARPNFLGNIQRYILRCRHNDRTRNRNGLTQR